MSTAAKIIERLKESSAPGQCTWGDEYPEAHKKLFDQYFPDMVADVDFILNGQVAGLSQAEHDDWIEDAYGKPSVEDQVQVELEEEGRQDKELSDELEVNKVRQALRLIAAHRSRSSVRLLDACYGPQAKQLRTQVLALLLDRKVTGSDKEVQWGRFRDRMWRLLGVAEGCIAAKDAEFEAKAEKLLKSWTAEEILRNEG